jgi:hypothetical protein
LWLVNLNADFTRLHMNFIELPKPAKNAPRD